MQLQIHPLILHVLPLLLIVCTHTTASFVSHTSSMFTARATTSIIYKRFTAAAAATTTKTTTSSSSSSLRKQNLMGAIMSLKGGSSSGTNNGIQKTALSSLATSAGTYVVTLLYIHSIYTYYINLFSHNYFLSCT